jgi:hypothetical protein
MFYPDREQIEDKNLPFASLAPLLRNGLKRPSLLSSSKLYCSFALLTQLRLKALEGRASGPPKTCDVQGPRLLRLPDRD